MSQSPDSQASNTVENASGPAAPEPAAPPLERLSDSLQRIIGAAVGANRKPPRALKSFLNGTWLGHPLHPAITDVPIATWLLAAVFDIIWLVGPAANPWAARSAEVAILLGVLAALGAIVTGMVDWSDTYGHERRVGLLHGSVNLASTIFYAVSAGVRLSIASGESITGVVLAFIGLVLVIYAAYLGGEMVFTLGTNVNHTAWEAVGEDFEPVVSLSDVPENKLYRATAAGVPIVLLRLGDQLHAISATCPHAGGPLDEGTLDDGVVQCPWHGSRFRMRDGHVLTGPATADAPHYLTRVRDGMVEIKRSDSH